jgi:hypothetical protein
MKILKIKHFTYFVIFHLKVIVCQNVNLPHTYDHNPQKHPFVIWQLLKFSHSSQTYSNHMKSQFLIDNKKIITPESHFNHFLSIIAFLSTQWCRFFCHIHTLELHNISWKKKFFDSIPCVIIYHIMQCFLEKYAIILPWLKFKHRHLYKTIQCDHIFSPPMLCFHPFSKPMVCL